MRHPQYPNTFKVVSDSPRPLPTFVCDDPLVRRSEVSQLIESEMKPLRESFNRIACMLAEINTKLDYERGMTDFRLH